MASRLVSVDPGKNACAWADFRDGVLEDCGLDPGLPFPGPDLLVVELPQIYQQRKQKGDPNALVDLAFAAGVFTSGAMGIDTELLLVRPRAWKGTRPKHVCNKITLNALTEEEKARIPNLPKTKLHNVLDAIGIGLWRLGRR